MIVFKKTSDTALKTLLVISMGLQLSTTHADGLIKNVLHKLQNTPAFVRNHKMKFIGAGVGVTALSLYNYWSYQPNSLSQYRDRFYGKCADLCAALPMRYPAFFEGMNEDRLFGLSRLKAKQIFWHAYNTVPAYKEFVDEHCPDGLLSNFENIPVTSKDNYIKKNGGLRTLVHGTFPTAGQIDTSTGTSGKPTQWIRGRQELENVKHWIAAASRIALGDKPYIFCNMFALGPWATGMTASYSVAGKQMVLSIGPNIEMLFNALQTLGKEHRYVIAGYPPHLRALVEKAPFNIKEYDITMIYGGEGMSESVRKILLDQGIKAVFSSYGASDLRINIAQQTEFEQRLQELCLENKALKEALLGTQEGSPIFFHYNPLLDYIEETEQGDLLFTDLDITRVSPRVRYNLGDKGKILKSSFVINTLKQFGYDFKPRTTLPILCLYGRGEDALTFNGANLMASELESAIKKIPGLFDKINRFAFNKFENKQLHQQLEFWLELKEKVSIDDLAIKTLNEELIAALCNVNQDFKSQIGFIKQGNQSNLPLPMTFVFEHGKSPMIVQSAHHKQKYVYNVSR